MGPLWPDEIDTFDLDDPTEGSTGFDPFPADWVDTPYPIDRGVRPPTEELGIEWTACGPLRTAACSPLVDAPWGGSVYHQMEEIEFGPNRDFDDLRPWVPDDVTVSDGFTDCEAEMVALMLGVLHDNVDILEWAMCVAAGVDQDRVTEENKQCLRDRIANGVFRRPLELIPKDPPCGIDKNWGMSAGHGKITMCLNRDGRFGTAVDMYCHCDDPALRLCAVLSQAVTLLHELAHGCDFQHDDEERAELGITKECQEVHLLMQCMSYGLFPRYPDAAGSGACDAWATLTPGDGGDIGQLPTDFRCPGRVFALVPPRVGVPS